MGVPLLVVHRQLCTGAFQRRPPVCALFTPSMFLATTLGRALLHTGLGTAHFLKGCYMH